MGTGGNRVLRYMAILAAARDFGVAPDEIQRVARSVDPRAVSPRTLADVLADALAHQRSSA